MSIDLVPEESGTLDMKKRELEIQYARMFIQFAEFGFSGTLKGSLVGVGLIALIALLDAFAGLQIDSWVYAFMSGTIAIIAIPFGYLSLWSIPHFAAEIADKFKITVSPNKP